MTKFLYLILLLSTINVSSQNWTDSIIDKLDNKIYIVAKASKAKSSFFSKKFNKNDTIITHIGLGYKTDKKFLVTHVTDREDSKNALIIESLYDFTNTQNKTTHLSIWAINSCNDELQDFIENLKKMQSIVIEFDFDFKLNNGENKLYCSEFCYKVLSKTLPDTFKIKPQKIILEGLAKAYLKRNELVFYPVDFFQSLDLFEKVIEIKL